MVSFIQYAASFLLIPACRSVEYVYILLHSRLESTDRQSGILYKLNWDTYLSVMLDMVYKSVGFDQFATAGMLYSRIAAI